MTLVNTRQYLKEALVEGCLQVPSQNTALSFRDCLAAHCCSEELPQGQQSPESQPCPTVLAAAGAVPSTALSFTHCHSGGCRGEGENSNSSQPALSQGKPWAWAQSPLYSQWNSGEDKG